MIMDPLGECAKTSVDNGKAHVTIPIDAVAVSMKRISMAVHESSATPIVTKCSGMVSRRASFFDVFEME